MNHKRRRSKNRRAGCLLCKPQKMNHAKGIRRRSTKAGGHVRRQEARANAAAKEQGAL